MHEYKSTLLCEYRVLYRSLIVTGDVKEATQVIMNNKEVRTGYVDDASTAAMLQASHF